MEKLFCDICGKEVDYTLGVTFCSDAWNGQRTFDLCKKDFKEFLAFFKRKQRQ